MSISKEEACSVIRNKLREIMPVHGHGEESLKRVVSVDLTDMIQLKARNRYDHELEQFFGCMYLNINDCYVEHRSANIAFVTFQSLDEVEFRKAFDKLIGLFVKEMERELKLLKE